MLKIGVDFILNKSGKKKTKINNPTEITWDHQNKNVSFSLLMLFFVFILYLIIKLIFCCKWN